MLFNENFLEYVSKSSSSIDFMQALKRAKEESIKLQNQSSNDSTRIMERIKKYNLHLNPDTDNTGDCQFDSVADQLKLVDKKYDGITKEEVRIIAIDWLRKNGDYKLDSEDPQSETLRSWVYITQDCLDWNTYCDKMSKAREWGDEITFKSITEAFNVKIVLISSTVDEVNFISEHKPKTETEETKKLFLCHFLEVHYCSLITEKVLKENEEKKKDKLISLLKRANQTLQKKTILDVFCMDSPQNEIPRQFMEELIDSNELGLEELIDNLRNMTNVYTIKVHRITQLEEKVGPLSLEVPVNNNKTNSANGSKLVNTGVVENLNSKIKSLESMLEHRDKVVLEKDEEILILKRKLEEYAEYIDKQNLKIEQYEHNILKESSVPKKNELFVADILPKEIVLKFHLVDEPAQGYYAVLYKEENVFCEKQHLPTKSQGEIYFTKPEVVQKYCFKLYNPKHEVLATSPNFIISPKIIFNEPKIVDNYIDINWEIKEGKSSSYDWVGIFKFDNPKNHIQYFYNPPNNLNLLKFSIPTEKGQYKFQYFCGENKYLPVSERNFTV